MEQRDPYRRAISGQGIHSGRLWILLNTMLRANFYEAVECTDLSNLGRRDDRAAWLNETPPDPQ